MERSYIRSLIVQQKIIKQSKAKKKPIKVVYISNPIRVKTSAEEFRSVVQELTGQDSDATVEVSAGSPEDVTAVGSSFNGGCFGNSDSGARFEGRENPCKDASKNNKCLFEGFVEPVTPQMLDYLPGYLPSPFLYEELP